MDAWLLWQLADSALPTGGFAHSAGLEAAVQQGEVRPGAELRDWLVLSIEQVAQAAVPFVKAAHSQPARLPELDEHYDAFTVNHVANRASRRQGRAWLAAVHRVFGAAAGLSSPPFGHLPPVFGATTRALGLTLQDALRLFVFLHLRGTVAAAVRLNVLGPLAGQALQFQLSRRAELAALRGAAIELEDAAQTAPLLELWQATHDRLYSRLFQS